MHQSEYLAILSLDGELADAKVSGEHSCLVRSKVPITQELLDAAAMDIGSSFVIGNQSDLEERNNHPFSTVQQILAKHGMEVVDVANIWVPRAGQVWIQEAGYNYHVNKLQRLSFESVKA